MLAHILFKYKIILLFVKYKLILVDILIGAGISYLLRFERDDKFSLFKKCLFFTLWTTLN